MLLTNLYPVTSCRDKLYTMHIKFSYRTIDWIDKERLRAHRCMKCGIWLEMDTLLRKTDYDTISYR